MQEAHVPVLEQEIVVQLKPAPNQSFVDATFGGGGHTKALLKATAPKGKVYAFDVDQVAVDRAHKLGARVHPFCKNFRQLATTLYAIDSNISVDGVLFDLGYSSLQLADQSRGLSFLSSGPLDMRLSRQTSLTAAAIVNTWSLFDLTSLFRSYGEERHAQRIARAIIKERSEKRFTTTDQLVELVKKVTPGHARLRIHPATRIFQALRIAVNDELGSLKEGLQQAMQIIRVGGRIAVISFHSLEDRIVKQMFREAAKKCVCATGSLRCTCGRIERFRVITKKPIVPSAEEVAINSRARSAKLRVIEKTHES